VQRAEMAMHELHITVHYLSCGDAARGLPKRCSQSQRNGNESRGT
jgi:hypothetical protein